MVGRTKPILKADRERFDKLKAMPCLTCSIARHAQAGVTTIHHLLSGGRRRGHQYTIPLCVWCHQGEPNNPYLSKHDMHNIYGPSLARTPKAFRERYGPDDTLLSMTDAMLRRAGPIA